MNQTNLQNTPQHAARNPSLQRSEMETFKKSFCRRRLLRHQKRRLAGAALRPSSANRRRVRQAKQSGDLFSGGGLMRRPLNCSPARIAICLRRARRRGVIDLIEEMEPKSADAHVGCNFNPSKSATQHYHCDRISPKEFLIATSRWWIPSWRTGPSSYSWNALKVLQILAICLEPTRTETASEFR